MGKVIDTIEEIAKKKEEVGKKLEMTSTRRGRIRDWERSYERKELDREEILSKLREEFGYHLDMEDYEEIKKEI